MNSDRLFLLAFDHRQSLRTILEEAGHSDATPEVKGLVADGFARALLSVEDPRAAGILIDFEVGADVASRAREQGWVFALALEESGRRQLGISFDRVEHALKSYQPTFGKVLIRYNPGDPEEERRRQADLVRAVGQLCSERGAGLMLELLVPPLPTDVARTGGSLRLFDSELRPHLTVDAVNQIRSQGIHPAAWKVEGFSHPNHYHAVSAAILEGAKVAPLILTLGRGAELETVRGWLEASAGVPGYSGFAVGRSVWQEPVLAVLSGSIPRWRGVEEVAERYLDLIGVFTTPP